MKLKTILVIAFFTITARVHAQNISIGPSVGLQHSWISADLPESSMNTIHLGFNGGIALVYSTESHFGFGADLKYSQEGVSIQSDLLGIKTVTDWNTSYLRLPLRLIYFFGDYGDAIRPKLFAGPTMGLLLSSKSEGVDVMDSTNGFDLGVHAGVGLNIRVWEKIWLNTDLTYNQGLSDVTDSDTDKISNHNGNVGINIGLLLGF